MMQPPQMQQAPQMHHVPPSAPQPMMQPAQALMPPSEPTNLGAQALLDDPHFGWGGSEQQPAHGQMPAATGARLETNVDPSYKIRSNSRWVILAVFLIVTASGAIAILAMR
jgi:hypothetical protein